MGRTHHPALLGISNTLSLAAHERRHELGLLRAVGQTRRQVRSVLRLESVIASVFGTVVGLALGGFGLGTVRLGHRRVGHAEQPLLPCRSSSWR